MVFFTTKSFLLTVSLRKIHEVIFRFRFWKRNNVDRLGNHILSQSLMRLIYKCIPEYYIKVFICLPLKYLYPTFWGLREVNSVYGISLKVAFQYIFFYASNFLKTKKNLKHGGLAKLSLHAVHHVSSFEVLLVVQENQSYFGYAFI